MKRNKKDKPFFSHGRKPIRARLNPETGDYLSLKEYCEELKKAEFDNDMGLRFFVQEYLTSCKENQKRAVTMAMGKLFSFSDKDQRDIIQKAVCGDLEAIQYLVRENPAVIYLPFVAKAVIGFLNEYKHTTNLKGKDLKKQWNDFLPSRANNPNPYGPHDLSSAFKIAQKESKTAKEAKDKIMAFLDKGSEKTLRNKGVSQKNFRQTKKRNDPSYFPTTRFLAQTGHQLPLFFTLSGAAIHS